MPWSYLVSLIGVVAAVLSIEIAQYLAMSEMQSRLSAVEARQETFLIFMSSPLTTQEEEYLIRKRIEQHAQEYLKPEE